MTLSNPPTASPASAARLNPPSAPDGPIRVAIAGLGKMGIMHAAMIEAMPGAEVAALVDREAPALAQARSMFSRPVPVFESIEACLAEARPDGVIVSTPQFTHQAVAEACLRAGAGVLCEKPLAHTLESARAMAALAASHPEVPAGTGYMLAFNPVFIEAARLARDGALGEVRAVRASCCLSQVFAPNKGWTFTKSKAGGGVVVNSGSHLLFALLNALGPARGCVARGAPMHNEVEDAFGAIIDFESGAWATVDITWSVPGYEFQTHDLRIEGTHGVVEASNEALRVWLSRPWSWGDYAKGWTEKRRTAMEPRAAFSLSPDYCGDEFYLEDEDFVAALRDGRQPRVPWSEALKVQELLDALYRSMEGRDYVRLE